MSGVHWPLAERIARRMAGSYPLEGTYHDALLARRAPELVERAAGLVAEETGLAWSGIVAGCGYILLVIGFWLGGQQHPLFWGGSLAALIGYAVWAIWLGRAVLSGTLAAVQ